MGCKYQIIGLGCPKLLIRKGLFINDVQYLEGEGARRCVTLSYKIPIKETDTVITLIPIFDPLVYKISNKFKHPTKTFTQNHHTGPLKFSRIIPFHILSSYNKKLIVSFHVPASNILLYTQFLHELGIKFILMTNHYGIIYNIIQLSRKVSDSVIVFVLSKSKIK